MPGPEVDDLSEKMRSVRLDPEWLLFDPTGPKAWVRDKFDDIPRYLFRVYTPKSRGITDAIWTKSMDARLGSLIPSDRDIFARDNDRQVAGMLHRHLNWWMGQEDNLVSWTSSLLFAIMYIFYLHASSRDGSAFGSIFLCVVDTTDLPRGVFLRDMDLIEAYLPFDGSLKNFRNLRLRKHKSRSGSYYFGEYFSQGALKIEGKCQVVPAKAMIDRGLYDLQPEFRDFAEWEKQLYPPPWAEPVLRLREEFYQEGVERQSMSTKELDAVMHIAELFSPRWRLPVAANLIALRPRQRRDVGLLSRFRVAPFTGLSLAKLFAMGTMLIKTDNEREDWSPMRTKIVAYSTLPEVQQYREIMYEVYQDFCAVKINGQPEKIRNIARLGCQSKLMASSFQIVRKKLKLDCEMCFS